MTKYEKPGIDSLKLRKWDAIDLALSGSQESIEKTGQQLYDLIQDCVANKSHLISLTKTFRDFHKLVSDYHLDREMLGRMFD